MLYYTCVFFLVLMPLPLVYFFVVLCHCCCRFADIYVHGAPSAPPPSPPTPQSFFFNSWWGRQSVDLFSCTLEFKSFSGHISNVSLDYRYRLFSSPWGYLHFQPRKCGRAPCVQPTPVFRLPGPGKKLRACTAGRQSVAEMNAGVSLDVWLVVSAVQRTASKSTPPYPPSERSLHGPLDGLIERTHTHTHTYRLPAANIQAPPPLPPFKPPPSCA